MPIVTHQPIMPSVAKPIQESVSQQQLSEPEPTYFAPPPSPEELRKQKEAKERAARLLFGDYSQDDSYEETSSEGFGFDYEPKPQQYKTINDVFLPKQQNNDNFAYGFQNQSYGSTPTHSSINEIFDHKNEQKPVEEYTQNENFDTQTVERSGYKDAFSGFFAKDENKAFVGFDKYDNFDKFGENQGNFDSGVKHFNDLKQSLLHEKLDLRSYSKENSSSFYKLRFIHINRLLRDCSLLVFLAISIVLLILFLAREAFDMSPTSFYIIGGVSILVPVFGTLNWYLFKEKRIKAQFNFKNSLIDSLIWYAISSAVLMAISILFPTTPLNFAGGGMFAGLVFLLNIPIATAIYAFLYNSKNYHVG
jgi:hypothetical protein